MLRGPEMGRRTVDSGVWIETEGRLRGKVGAPECLGRLLCWRDEDGLR